MKFKPTIFPIGAAILWFLSTSLCCGQRINSFVNRSLFTDKQAFEEGDVVTILLMEFTEGSNLTETNTNSENRGRADAATTGKLVDLLPSFGMDSQITHRSDNRGATTTRGELQGKMTAIITEVTDNGLLSIQGSRVVIVNGEKQTTILTGVVRPEDIAADNTLYSYNIANAQISYKGKGMVTDAGKPGILTRIWNWIF